jgi:predicted RNase H-like HicB family nuclease
MAVFEEIPAQDGGGYSGYVQGFPEALSEGKTLADAREELVMAIEYVLTTDRQFIGQLLVRNRTPGPPQPGGRVFREEIKVWIP